MTEHRIVSRSEAGLARPRKTLVQAAPLRGELFLHHSVTPAMPDDPHAAWRAVQAAGFGRGFDDISYCVDEQTEMFTRRGWVRYADVVAGEEALTLNVDTGCSEWQPIDEVCIFAAKPRELILVEGQTHSSLSTPGHRWPVERERRRAGVRSWERRIVTTETLGIRDRLLLGAPPATFPSEAKYSDGWVELVAWFWTEGHIVTNRAGAPTDAAVITQSLKNPSNIARIHASLTESFGPETPQFPRLGARTDGRPRWRSSARDDRNRDFHLSTDAGRMLQEVAPARVVRRDFLDALTRAQLELFLQVSLLADRCGPSALAQKDPRMTEAFAYAAILSGRAVSYFTRPPSPSTPYEMHGVYLKTWTHAQPVVAKYKNPDRWRIEKVRHEGIVWCPRTPNGTWYARRRGTTYFTGNTWGVHLATGTVLEGRSPKAVGAHTEGYNSTAHAVVLIGNLDAGDELTMRSVDAVRWVRGHAVADRLLTPAHRFRPHRAVKATACPGRHAIALWDALTVTWQPPAPTPVPPAPAADWTEEMIVALPELTLQRRREQYDDPNRHQQTKNLQGLLQAANRNLAIDGDFGPATDTELRAWQQAAGCKVTGTTTQETWRTLLGA